MSVHQAHFLRRAIGIDVVRKLAKASTRLDVESLGGTSRSENLPAQDRMFHRGLFAVVGMAEVFDKVQPLLAPLHRCAALRAAPDGTAKEHRDILVRIEAGDPDGAAQAMASHLMGEIADLHHLRKAIPEMFSKT